MHRTAVRPGGRLPGWAELVARRREPLTWLILPAVALFVRLQPERLQLGVRALVALGLVVAACRRPDLALLGLVVGLPVQLLGLASLYAAGVPDWVVRSLGFWKEAVVVGCALAAVRAWRAAGVRPDAVDWAAGGYVAIVGMYYAVPAAFVAADATFPGPPTDRPTLNVALRTEVLFVVLLVAVRHLDLGPGFRDRFARTVFAVGVAVAAVGIVELVASDGWNHLMVDTLQVPRYKLEILGVTTRTPLDVRVHSDVGSAHVVRIGSLFLDQLACGLWLVPPFVVGLHRLLRGAGAAVAAGTCILGVALVGTQTRAALLAALVAGACVLRRHAGVDRAARARVGALLVAAGLALVPLAVGTGLVQRTVGGDEGDAGSTRVHLQRSKAALEALGERPFGRGLGTGANTAARFDVQSGLLSENYYLQVANETGVVSLGFFVVLVALALRRLAAHRDDGDLLAAAWRGAFLGLSVAALLLHVWENLAVAWMAWIGVGLVLSARRPDDVSTEPSARAPKGVAAAHGPSSVPEGSPQGSPCASRARAGRP